MDNFKKQLKEMSVSSDLLFGIKCMTLDMDLNVIYCVNNENQLICIEVNKHLMTKCCDISLNYQTFDVICVEFMSEERSVLMASKSGHIVVFNTMTNECQTVGSLSDGIQSVAISLDQELIVLLTKNNSMVLMNKLFDVLTQKDLKTEEFGIHSSVSVNWGSKLTQFHGEGKRDIRTQTEEMKSFSDFDDMKSRISWRSDGLYFITSYFDSKMSLRKLQVWSRDGVLQYTSEVINGLEHHISWKPSGALIASSQMMPNKHLIVFIEKNGLKHGEFELPFGPNTFKIESILWSNDSKVLMVLGTECVQQMSKQIVMFWRQTNYKWDLKQRLQFTDTLIVNAMWDPIDATLLHIILNNGQYLRYRWKWSVDVSDGTVGLVDGNRLKLTNFERSVIPPPMFSYSFDFESQIIEICFTGNKFAVILSDETILLFEKSGKTTEFETKMFSISYENMAKNEDKIYECFYVNKCEGILNLTLCVIDQKGIIYGITEKQLFCFDFRNDSSKLENILDINRNIDCMSCLDSTLAMVATDGQLFKVDLETKTIDEWKDKTERTVVFSKQCSQLELFKLEDRIVSICLTENFTLYSENEVLSQNNCNSFIKFKDRFLLFTTTDHLLNCWPISDQNFAQNNYPNNSRSVERGSKIIAVTSDGKVVLQMPRGNLEAIYPRPLLLDLIKSKLDVLEFDSAFDLLRKHRINLNLICDYNSIDFNTNIELFIQQISRRSIQWICLFLTELSNQDLNHKFLISSNQCLNRFRPKTTENSNKIDLICDSMREVMERLDPNLYLNPILLTFVKKSASEIGNALKRIRSVENPALWDKAIKFLLYIIDINTLYEESLGTYDSDIFLMVASKSQKDPKEYLALLDEINKIQSKDYKCFTIDMKLKRYKKALTHISKCEQHFEECLQLIQSHSLYKESVLLFDNSSEEKKKIIWKLYANYLFNKKYFEESAIAYKKANDLVSAVKAYQLSANWNAAIDTALKCQDLVNVETVARNLAKHLITVGKHTDASYLIQIYAKDSNESIKILIDGHEWEHALRLMGQTPDEENERHFRYELIKHFESVFAFIQNNYQILLKHINRLEIVSQKQSEKNKDLKSYDNFDDKSDIYSETSSLSQSNTSSQRSTSSSLKTKKSRKSSKKSEKKKYVLKEGSVDEMIQLVYAINELIQSIDRSQEEVFLLIKTLYNFDYSDKATEIQTKFSYLLDLINEIIYEIWTQNETQIQTEESIKKYKINDPELMKSPQLRKIDWKLALI